MAAHWLVYTTTKCASLATEENSHPSLHYVFQSLPTFWRPCVAAGAELLRRALCVNLSMNRVNDPSAGSPTETLLRLLLLLNDQV